MSADNHLLYRSYLLDKGTGLYYLQSRYYNPKVGRFLNADGLVSTGQGLLGNNMFTYCGNNPVVRIDITGEYWFYVVDENSTETEIIAENAEGTQYKTTITFETRYYHTYEFLSPPIVYTKTVSFEYTVNKSGVILYDNNQNSSKCLMANPVQEELATEMSKVAKKQVNDSLQKRSITGIGRELKAHYMSYKLYIFRSKAEIAFVGGRGDTGYDKNGWFFEWFKWLF